MGERGNLMISGRVVAGYDLLGRAGAHTVEVRYDDVVAENGAVRVEWYAEATWNGTQIISAPFPWPAQAMEDLLGRALNGGECTWCKQTTIIGLTIEGFCCQTIVADDIDTPSTYRYVRSCGGDS